MVRLVGVGSRVPRDVYEKIVEDAKRLGVTRSEVIRHILTQHYEREEEAKKEVGRRNRLWRWLEEHLL